MAKPAEFGELLRAHRVERRFTQRHLAELVGVTGNYIALLEGGRRSEPSRPLLERLAEALTLDVHGRDQLYAAAGFAPAPGHVPAPSVHIAHQALERFLSLPAGSAELAKSLHRVIQLLLGAAAQRRMTGREKSVLREAQLVGLGYFHRSTPPRGSDAGAGETSAYTQKQERLANRIERILRVLADGSIDISKRIRWAEELGSLAGWKAQEFKKTVCSGSEPSSRTAKRPLRGKAATSPSRSRDR